MTVRTPVKVIEEKQFDADYNIRLFIPFRELNGEDGKEYKDLVGPMLADRMQLIEEGILTEEEAADHFATFFDLDGLLTDPKSVQIDFRHKGVSTGAELIDTWIEEDYPIRIKDKDVKIRVRMAKVRVYKNNRLYITDKNDMTVDDGSAYDAVVSGRVRTWSVEFRPVTQATTTGGLTVFRSYHLVYLSLLDVAQGVPDARIDSIRELKLTKKQRTTDTSINTYSMNDEIIKLLQEKMAFESSIDDLSLVAEFSSEGKQYRANIRQDGDVEVEEQTAEDNSEEEEQGNEQEQNNEDVRALVESFKEELNKTNNDIAQLTELVRELATQGEGSDESQEEEEQEEEEDEDGKEAERVRQLAEDSKKKHEQSSAEESEHRTRALANAASGEEDEEDKVSQMQKNLQTNLIKHISKPRYIK